MQSDGSQNINKIKINFTQGERSLTINQSDSRARNKPHNQSPRSFSLTPLIEFTEPTMLLVCARDRGLWGRECLRHWLNSQRSNAKGHASGSSVQTFTIDLRGWSSDEKSLKTMPKTSRLTKFRAVKTCGWELLHFRHSQRIRVRRTYHGERIGSRWADQRDRRLWGRECWPNWRKLVKNQEMRKTHSG